MIRIHLIRHGTTDAIRDVLCGRMPDVHLNAAGQQQAQDLGRNIAEIGDLQAVYASPLDRAQETAAPIASAQGLAVQTEAGFIELDYGGWTGRCFEDVRKHDYWAEYNRFRSMSKAPGGESLMEVQSRAWSALFRILGTTPDDRSIAIVTHGDVIRALMLLFLGMPLDFIYRLEVQPASICTVSAAPGFAPVVHSLNRTFYGV